MAFYTDWILIRRLAKELAERFSGARVQGVGHLPDGRVALELWKERQARLLAFDLFAGTPLVSIEDGELAIEAPGGFVRAAGAALRQMVLASVRSRRGDRLLRFDFAARSRFGVESGYSLIAELVPRFGNLLLLKDDRIVASLKEFAGTGEGRSSMPGALYEPPPLPKAASLPPLLAASAAAGAHVDPDAVDGPLYVYRRAGTLVAAHVMPLAQFADAQLSREDSLLAVLRESRALAQVSDAGSRSDKRRRDLQKTLLDRERKLTRELETVERKLREVDARESLREQGEAIYATLHELAPHERAAVKDDAAKLFAKYKKLQSSQSHLFERRAELHRARASLEQLQWELERARDDDLEDVEQAVAHGARRSTLAPRKPSSRKRKPLAVLTKDGSRILIGRSPVENADLTFRVARPDDLWFHAQQIPGAHVILQRDDKSAPSETDIARAAELAAYYSKAQASTKVLVDYTERKHVRKQPGAAPGLVFYTNPRSIYVEPRLLSTDGESAG